MGPNMVKIKFAKPLNRRKHLLLAPFSARHRLKARISEQPVPIQLVFRHIIMSDDLKLLFVQNSKAGCTSTAQLIFEYSRGHRYDGNIHLKGSKLVRGLSNWDIVSPALTDSSAYKFTVVRHPVDRALSGFKNFFVDKRNRIYPKYRRVISAFGYRDDADFAPNFDAFLDFIETSLERSPDFTDPHFRAQVKNVAFGTISYDRICRLENFAEDIALVFAEAGLEFANLGEAVKVKGNPTKMQSFAPSEDQKNRLRKIYRDDFEAFGY